MAWLDDYTFRLGTLYREEECDTEEDVREVMQDVTELPIESIRSDPTQASLVSNGPDADLHVFPSRSLDHLRQGFQFESDLAAKLRRTPPSREELDRFPDLILHKRRFSYVGFPDGGLRFDPNVEVKAVVVKSGHLSRASFQGPPRISPRRIRPVLRHRDRSSGHALP